MRGAVGDDRSLDALNDGHRSARDRELPHIERHGEQNAAERCAVGTYRASLPPETSVLRSAVFNDCTMISEDDPVGVPATRAFRFVLKTLEPILVSGE
jgi:hypothetical protein